MSSTGQIVGGIVGAVVGFYTGVGPVYGAQVGMMIGGAIDPPDGPVINGPRLDDLSVQTATYGAFIPRNYGTIAQTGNIFWLKGDALTETPRAEESGGKGGPTSTTNTWDYSATFALGLCDGPIDDVKRIWINGQLWYDATAPVVTGTPASGSVLLELIAKTMASNENAARFKLYKGDDTQLPDPLMQADKGVANVPAYRGLAYIVFEDLPLAKFNNSLAGAQIKVEITKSASNDVYSNEIDMPSANWGDACWNGAVFVAVEDGGTNAAFSYDGINWFSSSIGSGNWTAVTWGPLFCAVSVTGSTGNCAISRDGVVWETNPMPSSNSWQGIAWNGNNFCAVASNTSYGPASATSLDGVRWEANAMPVAAQWSEIIWNGSIFCAISNGAYSATSEDGKVWSVGNMPYSENWISIAWDGLQFCAVSYNGLNSALSPDGINWTVGGALTRSGNWVSVAWNGDEFIAVNNNTYTAAAFSSDGITWTSGTIPGKSWSGVESMSGIFFAFSDDGTGGAMIYRGITDGQAVLGDIVEAECLTSNLLTAGDLDVTELTDTVRGYRVASLGALRGGIEPLRAAWPFDVVQHGYQIKFKRRGSASVATIDASELDARAAGENPGIQITNSREMDTLLPSSLRLKYIDSVREYDTNEQISDRGL